jgi:hypothetical protein
MDRKQNGIQMPQNALTEVKEDTSRNAEPPTAKKIVQSITLLGERFASEIIVSSELSAIVLCSSLLPNVKVMATPLAGASVERGVEVVITGKHREQRG